MISAHPHRPAIVLILYNSLQVKTLCCDHAKFLSWFNKGQAEEDVFWFTPQFTIHNKTAALWA